MAHGPDGTKWVTPDRLAIAFFTALGALGWGTTEMRQSDQANRFEAFEAARIEIVRANNRRLESIEDEIDGLERRAVLLDERAGDLEQTDAQHIAQRDAQVAQIQRQIELIEQVLVDLRGQLSMFGSQLARLEGRFIEQPARADHMHMDLLRALSRPRMPDPQTDPY